MNAAAASLSLIVGRGAATTITASSNFSGIALLANSTSASGDLTLTVGSAGAVVIRERTGDSGGALSHGIHMVQRGGGATTAAVRSGVTIGAAATPMLNRGIYLELNRDAANRGGGAASLTSGAEIHTARQGLYVWRSGSAQTASATTITNTGAVSSGVGNAASTETGNLRPHGIVLNVAPPDDGSSDGDARITNSGGITVSGGYDGIRMNYNAFGDAEVDNRAGGDITATATGGRGIAFLYSGGSGAAAIKNAAVINAAGDNAGGGTEGGAIFMRRTDSGGGATSIENSGDVTATAASAIYAYALSGDVSVTNSGDLSGAGSAGRGIRVWTEGDGDISVTASDGAIRSASAEGIHVQSDGTGNVTVSSGADITAESDGIHVRKAEATGTAGDISIATTGGAITVEEQPGSGIYVRDSYARKGSTAIVNAADITTFDVGIHVSGSDRGRSSVRDRQEVGGDITVTHRGGTVLSRWQSGIVARSKVFNDVGDVTIAAMGGTVQSAGWGTAAIRAVGRGLGDAIVTIAAGATAISFKDAGVLASLFKDARLGSADNQVKIEMGGEILGRSGVSAQVLYNGNDETYEGSGETVAARAATAPPVIDIAWTGSFAAGTTAQTAPNDDGRLFAASMGGALAQFRDVETEKASGGVYGGAAGIEAQVMDWRLEVGPEVAKGDDPGEIADAAAQTALLAGARRDAILAQVRAALGSAEVEVRAPMFAAIKTGATGLDDLSDADIVAYLSVDNAGRRTLLRNVLASSLSDAEKAVLRALAMGDNAGLTAALDDADAAFSGAYKTAVRALLDRYHAGDIRIAMNGGSIASRGDGIRAYYTTPHANNGAISVTVADGATVTGANAGIYVANAGLDAGEAGTADDILKQTVTVHGMVTGGADAAVHLVGGGRMTVGETGKVHAGSSGRAIWVNDPGRAVIRIDGEVKGGAGAPAAVHLTGGGSITVGPKGRVEANGAALAIRGDNAPTQVTVFQDSDLANEGRLTKVGVRDAASRLGTVGGDNIVDTEEGEPQGTPNEVAVRTVRVGETTPAGYPTGYYLPAPVPSDGGEAEPQRHASYVGLDDCPDGQELQGDDCVIPMAMEPKTPRERRRDPLPISCDMMGSADRCRLYEALPSMLLAMNGLPTYAERSSASRDAGGGWARMEAANGKWQADASTRTDVAYDHSRYGVRAGVDFMAGGESAGLGLGMSIHGLRGSAKMAPVGEVDLSGAGVGVHATTMAGGIHVDVQAALTRYEVDLKSAVRGALKDGVKGQGFAVGVEAGQRMGMERGMFLTPRVGLMWSKVALDDFAEEVMDGARVSVGDAESLKGRAGAGVEKVLSGVAGMDSRLFGSLDVEQEFSKETEVKVSDTVLRTSASPTRLHLAVGGDHRWGGGRYALRGSLNYAAGGDGNRDYGAGLDFTFRF